MSGVQCHGFAAPRDAECISRTLVTVSSHGSQHSQQIGMTHTAYMRTLIGVASSFKRMYVNATVLARHNSHGRQASLEGELVPIRLRRGVRCSVAFTMRFALNDHAKAVEDGNGKVQETGTPLVQVVRHACGGLVEVLTKHVCTGSKL